jgi:hypothetical protein
MDLGEFLPYYPEETSKNLGHEIFKKKEFHDLIDRAVVGGFYRHQVFPARFLSYATPYRSLILFHEMGTGKSGAAAAVYEELRRMKPGLKTLYVSNNDSLLSNFKNEVFRLAPSLHDPTIEAKENPVYARNRILAEAGFMFTTYYRLAELLRRREEREDLVRRFRDNLVILDEVHHLVVNELDVPRGRKTNGEPAYNAIAAFLDGLGNRRLLLLTGTPMRDSPAEIVPLLNLALLPDRRLAGLSEYLSGQDRGAIPRLRWKEGLEDAFVARTRGCVSFYRQRSIPKEYEGEVVQPMRYYRLARHTMDELQTTGYERAFAADSRGKSSSFFSHCQQASLFVFPDGSFRLPEDNPYFIREKRLSRVSMFDVKRVFTRRFMREAGIDAGMTTEDRLGAVRRMSATYYHVIRSILRNPQKKMYVYCDKIYNSGILVCIQLLTQFFGFEFLTSASELSRMGKRRRCVLLHEIAEEESISKTTIGKLKDRFNEDDNMNGDYIQVLFGTDKTREGISLRHIQHIHVCAGDWNFGKIFQAIGRGIRLGSHRGLPEGTVVRVSLHCAVPKRAVGVMTESGEDLPPILASSIDFVRFYRAERKDYNIKLVEHALMTGAVDCFLHRDTNTFGNGTDGSAECMYRPCRYRCREEADTNGIIDVSSFNAFYATRFVTINDTVENIRRFFYARTLATFSDIQRAFPGETTYQLLTALAAITDRPLTIRFWDGRLLYLHRGNDVFYASEERLIASPPSPGDAWRSDYARNPSFVHKKPFSRVLEDLRASGFPALCSRLSHYHRAGSVRSAVEVFRAFSRPCQEAFLAVLARNHNASDMTRWLLSGVLSDVLFRRNDRWVWVEHPQNMHVLDDTGEWRHSARSVDPRYEDHEAPAFVDRYVRGKICYGYIDPRDNKFRIRDVSDAAGFTNKKDATKGKVCKSFDFYHLLFFLYVVSPECEPSTAEERRLLANILALTRPRLEERARELVPGIDGFLGLVAKHNGDAVEAMRFAVFHNERFHNKKTLLCERLREALRGAGLMVRPPRAS